MLSRNDVNTIWMPSTRSVAAKIAARSLGGAAEAVCDPVENDRRDRREVGERDHGPEHEPVLEAQVLGPRRTTGHTRPEVRRVRACRTAGGRRVGPRRSRAASRRSACADPTGAEAVRCSEHRQRDEPSSAAVSAWEDEPVVRRCSRRCSSRKREVTPAVAEARQLGFATAQVVLDRYLADFELLLRGRHDHLRGEFHPGRAQVDDLQAIAPERAHPPVGVAHLSVEENVQRAADRPLKVTGCQSETDLVSSMTSCQARTSTGASSLETEQALDISTKEKITSMFSSLRTRATYANVTATLALVFAMSGGALAATRVIVTSKKQISSKVLKELKGATGERGPVGLAGPTGTQGPAGTNGSQGGSGPEGKPGPEGAKGSPWTAGGVLPAGATETGTWSFGQEAENIETHSVSFPISFNIPLSGPLTASHVYYVKAGESAPAECAGGSLEHPRASEGNLCVYTAVLEGATPAVFEPNLEKPIFDPQKTGSQTEGSGASGAVLGFRVTPESYGWGDWAVTG